MPKVSVKTSKKTSPSSGVKKTATKAKTPLKSGAKKKAPVTKSKAVVTKKPTPLYSGAKKKTVAKK